MQTSDLIALFGIGFTVLAAYAFARWQVGVAWEVARDSGALRKPSITIRFLGQDLELSKDCVWCLLHPADPKSPAIYPFIFEIANVGDAPLEDFYLTITASSECILSGEPTIKVIPAIFADEIRRSVDDVAGMRRIDIKFPPLGPRTAISVSEQFRFQPTIDVPIAVDAKSADGVDIVLHGDVSVSLWFSISLFSRKGGCMLQRSVNFQCLPDNNFDEAVARCIKAIEREHIRWNSKLAIFERWRYRLFGKRLFFERVINLVKFEIARKEPQGKFDIYFMKAEGGLIKQLTFFVPPWATQSPRVSS